jgi:RNA polymerase sigma-B factor
LKKNEALQKFIEDNNNNGKKIDQHMEILKNVVTEFHNSGETEEELMQAGYIGLLNAINLYQSKIGLSFEEYANRLIAGEIRHYIREKNKKIKVPDWLSVMMNKLLNQMLMAYRKEYHKFPDFHELSQMMDLSPEMLKEAMKARETVYEVSIDAKRRKKDMQEPIDIDKIKKELKKRKNDK